MWSGVVESFRSLVKAVTCEVSVPTMPRRRSAGEAMEAIAKTYRKAFIMGHCTLAIVGNVHSTQVRERRWSRARGYSRNQRAAHGGGPAQLYALPLRRP